MLLVLAAKERKRNIYHPFQQLLQIVEKIVLDILTGKKPHSKHVGEFTCAVVIPWPWEGEKNEEVNTRLPLAEKKWNPRQKNGQDPGQRGKERDGWEG